ncbi:amidase family protein [Glacieibacterium frigidum]|uniref:Amidase domain-containing protein n=1 Tax=Glacieibacterium frigidum TaxID=2593303 RepID=A0A552U983_9SPHN|nr:amidase family protein [Glacieibacterium frigidum]TRW14771.1 hypothetical protein FMM06_13905 [Glacieibacterium frigidum]
MTIDRRGFLRHGATLAAVAPLSGVDARAAPPADAVAQAAAVAAGTVTQRALVDAAIARLGRINPRLNVLASENFARARDGAPSAGPLGGVPTLIKGNIEQGGLPFTSGSRAFAKRVGKADGAIAASIARAGLVSIGRTTLPEFGLLPTTEPLATGLTRNPWNLGHSSGGSSGGSAAAVAAGVVAVAHANDGGGSIRIPASCCNLVGLKPSRARMQGEQGARKVTDFGVNGCVSRTVRDTAAWFAACEVRGADAAYPPVGLVTGPSKARLRIRGLRASGLGVEPAPGVGRVFDDARRLLIKLGHGYGDARPAFDGPAVADAFNKLWSSGAAARQKAAADFLGRAVTEADIEPATLTWAAKGAGLAKPVLEAAVATMQDLERRYTAQFDDFDVLMTPVLALPPLRLGTLSPRKSYDEMRALLQTYVAYTPIENASGACAISLPIGFAGGLPVGIQFVARPGGERVLLELAYELENALGWHRMRPGVWAG